MDKNASLQKKLEEQLRADICFDLKRRPLLLCNKKGTFTYLIGFADSISVEAILSALMNKEEGTLPASLQELSEGTVPFGGCEVTKDPALAASEVLRGSAALTLEGYDEILLMDIRSFSTRPPEEPEKDRTLRGPHIGMCESLVSNLTQIRRLLRTPDLRTEKFILGTKIQNEVALLSISGKADETFLKKIRQKLQNAKLPCLSMTQETLAGILVPRKGASLLNPFPKVRYCERPDIVAASLMEGKIALLCDNTPSVILLPQSLFDFFEESDDYYFPPITASYLRLVRVLIFIAAVLLIPIWLLVVKESSRLPRELQFVLTDKNYAVPLFLQFLIIEFAIDGLKMASLNTPNTLSGSFSVIGGLLLGEFAVESGWFVPQAILYSAFTGIANFIPTNIELGYSFKLIRITLILLVEYLGLFGLLGGVLFWLAVLISTKGAGGKSYLYPFIPWDSKGVARIILRFSHGREQKK
ncbi:MAG: spore germination protein [Ruminococcaceae bacterium]|nr:spore germination protein [Oscillospiraceae bacterium]